MNEGAGIGRQLCQVIWYSMKKQVMFKYSTEDHLRVEFCECSIAVKDLQYDYNLNLQRPWKRQTRKPTWLEDYEVSYYSGAKYINHFSLFVDSGPVEFAYANKDIKWRTTMKVEMKSIEDNKT